MVRILGCILLAAFCAACTTPYQKKGLTGGFTESQLDDDVFEVAFKGNGFTSSEKVKKYFFRRCAEIAIENGKTHFIVFNLSNVDVPHHYQYTTQSTQFATANDYRGNFYTVQYSTPQTHTTTSIKSQSSGIIKLSNGCPENQLQPGAYCLSVKRLLQ